MSSNLLRVLFSDTMFLENVSSDSPSVPTLQNSEFDDDDDISFGKLADAVQSVVKGSTLSSSSLLSSMAYSPKRVPSETVQNRLVRSFYLFISLSLSLLPLSTFFLTCSLFE